MESNSDNFLDIINRTRGYYVRVMWFLLCNGINIISDNNERSSGSHCIGIGQTRVDNNNGHNCVYQTDGKQTDIVVISHSNGVDTTSHAVLNALSARKIVESNITCSLATSCTTNAPITSVQLPSSCAGNFKQILLLRNLIIVLQLIT